MTPALAFLVTLFVVAVASGAMLFVRRGAPDGSYFADGDRAAGVFGVLATGFSIMLGLVVVIAFTSYDDSRRGAESEALAVTELYKAAQFLPVAQRAELSGELVCYARSVIDQEWPNLESGKAAKLVNPWAVEMFATLKKVQPRTNAESSAFDKWLDNDATRVEGRRDRIHGAEGVIPESLWIVLFAIAAVIFGFMLFFADRGEGPFVQAALIGSVTFVIITMLFLIRFLDDPFRDGYAGLKPTAMERTLEALESVEAVTGERSREPCDADGRRL